MPPALNPNRGILIHSLNDLFMSIAALPPSQRVTLKVSYFEIYNDKLFDLLDQTAFRLEEPLQITEDKK